MAQKNKRKPQAYDEVWVKSNSSDIEMAVLGSALIEQSTFKTVMMECRAEWFYNVKNQKIFQCYKKYYDLGQEKVDLVIAVEWLKQDGLLGEIGGEMYLSEQLDKVTTTAYVKSYIKEIKDLYYRREFLKSILTLYQDPLNKSALEKMIEAYHDSQSAQVSGIKSLQKRVIDDAEELLKKKPHGYYDVGFKKFDKSFNGMMPGNLVTWAARPGIGKSSMMLKIAMRFARAGLPVLYFSTEMSYEETFMRMLTMTTEIENWHFRKRYYGNKEVEKVVKACAAMSKWEMYFNDKPSPNVADVRAGIISTKCKLVIFDYLQRAEFGEGDNKPQRVGNFVRHLKNLCREFEIVGFLGAQLSRETDHFNTRQRPQLADLKDSGEIEQESDKVVLMWKFNKKDRNKQKLVPEDAELIKPIECIIAKNRGGLSDVSEQFIFRENYMNFEEWDGDNLDMSYKREDLLNDPQNVLEPELTAPETEIVEGAE